MVDRRNGYKEPDRHPKRKKHGDPKDGLPVFTHSFIPVPAAQKLLYYPMSGSLVGLFGFYRLVAPAWGFGTGQTAAISAIGGLLTWTLLEHSAPRLYPGRSSIERPSSHGGPEPVVCIFCSLLPLGELGDEHRA
jgi:hypothetical protein